MKNLLLTSALLFGLLPGVATADCGDYVSYWETEDGICIDLTYMSNDSAQGRAEANPVFTNEIGEVEVTNLRITSNSIGADVRGVLKNTSGSTIDVFKVDYQLVTNDGTPIYSDSFIIGQLVGPGQSISIESFVIDTDLQGYRPSQLNVEALSIDY